MAASGIQVVAADMDDAASLQAAFAGAHGVYSVQGTDKGGEVETLRGIAVADAARLAGVKHFVYASVGGADRASGVPHFDSKWRVEEHVRSIGLPASIVRPVFFMEIAGDELTRPEIMEVFKRHGLSSGLPFPIPRLLLRPLPHDVRRMFEWFGSAGYTANLSKLKATDSVPLTLDAWLATRQANRV